MFEIRKKQENDYAVEKALKKLFVLRGERMGTFLDEKAVIFAEALRSRNFSEDEILNRINRLAFEKGGTVLFFDIIEKRESLTL